MRSDQTEQHEGGFNIAAPRSAVDWHDGLYMRMEGILDGKRRRGSLCGSREGEGMGLGATLFWTRAR